MASKILFHDEYTGQRWTYQLNFRQISSATAPMGWIIGSQQKGETAFGTIDYPRELTATEIAAYELTFLMTGD